MVIMPNKKLNSKYAMSNLNATVLSPFIQSLSYRTTHYFHGLTTPPQVLLTPLLNPTLLQTGLNTHCHISRDKLLERINILPINLHIATHRRLDHLPTKKIGR